jgi:hypothetical protein
MLSLWSFKAPFFIFQSIRRFVVVPFCRRTLLSRPFLKGHFAKGPFGKALMSPDGDALRRELGGN